MKISKYITLIMFVLFFTTTFAQTEESTFKFPYCSEYKNDIGLSQEKWNKLTNNEQFVFVNTYKKKLPYHLKYIDDTGYSKEEWKDLSAEDQKVELGVAYKEFDAVKAVEAQDEKIKKENKILRVLIANPNIKNLQWKEKYRIEQTKWEKLSFKEQLELLQSKDIDLDKAIIEEKERLKKSKQ